VEEGSDGTDTGRIAPSGGWRRRRGQFDFDQAVLRPEVKVRLDELAAKLDGAQFDRLDIVGYADPLERKNITSSCRSGVLGQSHDICSTRACH
jgi:hypothetical protein